MRILLCDYGQVLSLPQDPDAETGLASGCGLALGQFRHAYWRVRLGYDRGDLSAGQFWEAVAGRPLEQELVGELVRIDVEGWTRPNPASLQATASAAAERGLHLAVLSNAPVEIARALDEKAWMAPFSPRLFSCDLGEVKPHPDVYRRALSALGAEPDEVVFVDDSEANVAGARAIGIRAEQFSGPEVFARLAE